jgi:hypothetical protein
MRIVLASVLFACVAWADPASGCAAKAGADYQLSPKVKPNYFEADFDGDGKLDLAVVVTRGKAQGIAVCLGPGTIVIGAGTAFNDMKDLDFAEWKLHPKSRPVARGVGARRLETLSGDALLLEWESGSGVVYWNGRKFVWYQQGD